MNLKEYGAAASTNITLILNMIISDVIIRAKKDNSFEGMVFWYDETVFKDLGDLLKMSLPGILMLFF